MWTGNNSTTKRTRFVIVCRRFCGFHQKIELKLFPVDMAQHVHQPCFSAASVQATNNMQDTEWARIM
jgi:hypothetical protein